MRCMGPIPGDQLVLIGFHTTQSGTSGRPVRLAGSSFLPKKQSVDHLPTIRWSRQGQSLNETPVFQGRDRLIAVERHASWSWGLSRGCRCHVACAVVFEGDRMQSSSRSRACCIASLAAIVASGLVLVNLSGIDLAQADATASPTASQSIENQGRVLFG